MIANVGAAIDDVGDVIDNVGTAIDNVVIAIDNVGAAIDNVGAAIDNVGAAIDGRVTVDAVAFSSDLTIDSDGIASTSRLKLSVNSSDLLTALSGSEIEIADLGNADVEGSWSFGDVPRGSITVRGADTLVFDIGRFVNGCVPYRIGNEQGSVCPLGADESSVQALVGTRPPIWSRLLLGTKP